MENHLFTSDGVETIFSTNTPESRPFWRLRQFQVKLKGDIDYQAWKANNNAKQGAARQDGRPVGFHFLDKLVTMKTSYRKKVLRALERCDNGDFYYSPR